MRTVVEVGRRQDETVQVCREKHGEDGAEFIASFGNRRRGSSHGISRRVRASFENALERRAKHRKREEEKYRRFVFTSASEIRRRKRRLHFSMRFDSKENAAAVESKSSAIDCR